MVSGFLHAIKKMDSAYIEGVALSEWRKGIKPEEAEPWAQDRLVAVEGERARMATQLPRTLTTLIAKWLEAANLLPAKFWEERKGGESRKREAVPSGPDFGDRVGVIKEVSSDSNSKARNEPVFVPFRMWRRIYGLPPNRGRRLVNPNCIDIYLWREG